MEGKQPVYLGGDSAYGQFPVRPCSPYKDVPEGKLYLSGNIGGLPGAGRREVYCIGEAGGEGGALPGAI